MPVVALVSFCSCAWWWSRGGSPPGAGRVHDLRNCRLLCRGEAVVVALPGRSTSWHGGGYVVVSIIKYG